MNKHLPAIYNHKTSACLKFHILLFLCPGRLAFLCLLLPDAFLPPFQVPLYGRFLPRLGGLSVLLGWQYLIEPAAHIPQHFYICLNRFQFLPLFRQGRSKLFPFRFQIFARVGIAFQVGFKIPDGGMVSVQFLPVALCKLLFFFFQPIAAYSLWTGLFASYLSI